MHCRELATLLVSVTAAEPVPRDFGYVTCSCEEEKSNQIREAAVENVGAYIYTKKFGSCIVGYTDDHHTTIDLL